MHFIPNCRQSGQGITVRGPLFNASWTDDQSLIRRPRRFRVKPSLTRDLIWTALVQKNYSYTEVKVEFELGSSLIDVGETRPKSVYDQCRDLSAVRFR